MIKKKLVTVGLAMVLAMASSVVAFAAPMEAPVPIEQSVRLEAKLNAEDVQVLSQLFNANFFAKKYPSIAKALNNNAEAMFKYFCTWGVYEGKQCCAGFDVAAYAVAYPDLAKAFGTDVMAYYRHYVLNGRTEGRVFTTVEECRKNGIPTKMIESQRFALDENGRPAFVKFYDTEQKAFVYNEEEAKSTPAGTYSDYDTAKVTSPVASPVYEKPSDTPSYPEKKEEPAKKGFNNAAYQRDMGIWKSKQPDVKDYLEDGVWEEYEEALDEWRAKEPTLDQIKKGRIWASDLEAVAAYQSDHAAWEANEPEITDYLTEDKAIEFQGALETWNDEIPNPAAYTYNNYESADAASRAYDDDYIAWNERLVAWLEENNKNDYSVGYATQEAADAAYQQALFDFTVQLYNIDYDTQFKSKTKDEVANQKMVAEYSNYMALWTPWYMDKSNALSEWKMQNPTATIDDENAWVQNYLAEHPEPVPPTLEAIKATLVQGDDYEYENELEAGTAYRSTVTENMSDARQKQGAPQSYNFLVGKYATEDEANAARNADIVQYKDEEEDAPNPYDYWYNPDAKYGNLGEAETAYNQDYGAWVNAQPKVEDYANVSEYQAAYEAWEASEPKLDDGYYQVDSHVACGDGDYIAVTYVPEDGASMYEGEYYIDDRHYSNTPAEDELLEVLEEEWLDDMPEIDEEDWKEDGEEQYEENMEDWSSHEPERPQYEEGSDGNWEGCPDYEYVEPNNLTPPDPVGI